MEEVASMFRRSLERSSTLVLGEAACWAADFKEHQYVFEQAAKSRLEGRLTLGMVGVCWNCRLAWLEWALASLVRGGRWYHFFLEKDLRKRQIELRSLEFIEVVDLYRGVERRKRSDNAFRTEWPRARLMSFLYDWRRGVIISDR